MRPGILSIFFIILLLGSFLNVHAAEGALTEFEQKRAELLSKMIGQQMVRHHYLHHPLDGEISQKIFDSYLKQLDPQKTYLLESDVKILSGYSLQMGQQIQAGSLEFPLLAEEVLRRRVEMVQGSLGEIAAGDIDFHQDAVLQTDAQKRDYCRTEQELQERWHKVITHEAITEYLDLMEVGEIDAHAAAGGKEPAGEGIADIDRKNPEEKRKAAIEKVLQDTRMMLREISVRNTMTQINQYLAVIVEAFDAQSTYMPPRKHEDFTIDLRGSFEGIGANLEKTGEEIRIAKILDGGAAARQKQLQVGDSVLKVGQGEAEPVDLKGMELRDVTELVRGKKGTEVRLTVRKADGSVAVIPIVRDIVELKEKFVSVTPLPDPGNNKLFGYMKIPSFYRNFEKTGHGGNARNVSDDVRRGLEELKAYGIEGLVLDLRDNPGGANIDATYVGGFFFQYGPIQQTRDSDGKIESTYDFDPVTIYKGPMVVLVNEYSASTTEVLAGAMQDLKRAVVVGGPHTFGKGAAQKLINLDLIASFDGTDLAPYKPLGLLKITTQAVFRINGEPIQQRGIIPDIILPTPRMMSTTFVSHFKNSLQWDAIAPIKIEALLKQLDLPEIDLETLRQASRKRVAADDYFQKLIRASEEAEQDRSETEVVLDVDRIKEQRRRLREKQRSRNILWGYAHAGHGGQAGNLKGNAMRGEDIEDFHSKVLQSDPYIRESLSLLQDMAP